MSHCLHRCFGTNSPRLIKISFFLHFTFFIALTMTFAQHSNLLQTLCNLLLFIALMGSLLAPADRQHHLAHIGGLINIVAIYLDIQLAYGGLIELQKFDPILIPFFLHPCLRVLTTIALLSIGPEKLGPLGGGQVSGDADDDNNNNNSRYLMIDDSGEGSAALGKQLLADNRSTEV